jgi:hypothetical protein
MGRPPKVKEVVAAGVTRDEEKENPISRIENEEKVRTPGNWIKATKEELIKYEASGLLVGYDSEAGEVLLKEEK